MIRFSQLHRSLLVFAFAALVATFTACGATDTPVETASASENVAPLYVVDTFDASRDPVADLTLTMQEVAGSDRHIIAVVGGDWCPDCWNLDSFIEQNPAIESSLVDQYALFKVNYGDDNWNDDFLLQYPSFSWVPHFLIFDGDGNHVDSLDTRELMDDGSFADGPFRDFLASAQAN